MVLIDNYKAALSGYHAVSLNRDHPITCIPVILQVVAASAMIEPPAICGKLTG